MSTCRILMSTLISWYISKSLFRLGILISNLYYAFTDQKFDLLSWKTFMIPFHRDLWLSLLSLSLVNALVIWILHSHSQNSTSLGFLGAISISLSTSFGITVRDANDLGTSTSARLSLYVIFICGSIYFYVYTAFLTSALAVPSEYNPFQSPEEILQTNYR